MVEKLFIVLFVPQEGRDLPDGYQNAALKARLMCLTIPMQIKFIDGFQAVCEAKGIERATSLFMMQEENLKIGDYVMIQTGYAVQKVCEADAHAAWESFDEIMAMLESPDSASQQDE